MKRHWSWSLLIAAVLALHAHGWLHAEHNDDFTGANDSACVACQIAQQGGPLSGSSGALVVLASKPQHSIPLSSRPAERGHPRQNPIRGPPQTPEHIS